MNFHSPKRILVVDDDRSLRTLLSMVIEEEGYEVIEAQSGEDCLLQFSRKSPDLILLDAVMPEMDGFSCCEKLRALPESENTPILMITFLDDQESIEKAFAVGATDYLTKPIHWAVLLQRLKRLITSSQTIEQLGFLKNWQDILDILVQSLAKSCLTQEDLSSLLLKLQQYFAVDRALLKCPRNSSSFPEIPDQEKLLCLNSLAQAQSDPALVSLLTTLDSQACLLSPVSSGLSQLILLSQEPREWQEGEKLQLQQITTLLSYLDLT